MLNKWEGMGRLTKDPELRRTPSGTAVATISIAVDRDYKGKARARETDFIDIVAWRQTAEFVSKHLTKGRMAVVEGRLQIRDYTNKDGQKRRVVEIVADNIYFGDSKRDNDGEGSAYKDPSSYADEYGAGNDWNEIDEGDGECPF